MNYYAKLAEEKRNSTVARGTVHGHKYEVDRMSDGSYMGYVYDEDDYPIFKTGLHSTADGAEKEIKSKVFNSKDNSKVLDAEVIPYSDPDTHERYYKVWLITDEGYRNPRVFKTFQEADREAARIQREVKSKNPKENSMNYYEKIIQEKHNSAESHLKRLIGKRFKRDTDLERAVNGSIYTEISDWSHPRMIVFDKYSDEKFYVTTEDNHQYGKDQEFWISRVEKANSKEEKDNDSVEDKFRHKGCLITIVKKSSGRYAFSITQNGHEEMSDQTYSTQDEAERGAKREVEEVWSSKDNSKSYYQSIIEKKNADPEESMRKLQALKPIVEAFKRKGMTKHEVATRLMQEKDISETLAQQCVDSWY